MTTKELLQWVSKANEHYKKYFNPPETKSVSRFIAIQKDFYIECLKLNMPYRVVPKGEFEMAKILLRDYPILVDDWLKTL
jgi:hypothetical protein